MHIPDARIIEFIKDHHVLTIATVANSRPWCSHCFYAFDENEMCLIFTSDSDTRHSIEWSENEHVAGGIVLETSIVGKIQGIQFQGIMSEPNGDLKSKVQLVYLKRFPFAVLMNTQLWVIHLNFIKMTDNRLGFGKKIIWKREEE